MKARPQILMFALWLLSQALGFGMTGLFHESGHNAQPSAIGEQIPPVNYGYDTIQGASLAYDVAHTTPTLLDCILAVVAKETGYDYDQPIVLFIRKVESSRGPPSGFDGFLAAETGASLAAPGSRFTIGGVQATEIAGRMTPEEMAGLQAQHGTEFAQIYLTGPGQAGGGGTYYLIQGVEDSVQIPVGPNVRLISHTHPELLDGGVVPFEASGPDYNVLRLLQQAGSPQRTSQIVPEVGTPFNFRR